jgi:photosystem II stability/assembly factor-like uncharacterized protein
MKTLLTSILVLLSIFTYGQSYWQSIEAPVTENFVSVCFLNSSTGWIVSEEGTLIKTTDNGASWQIHPFSDVRLTSVHFADESFGCIVGWEEMPADNSLILITNDGGNNWQMADHTKVNRFNDAFFINNDKGWVVGSKDDQDKNCIYYTENGGSTWVEQTGIVVLGAELLGVSFRNETQGSVCGANGAFFITNSGGSSWAMGISMPVLNLNDIYNFGMQTGCIVGDEGTALYTINNWYQYVETVSNTTENLNAVSGDPATNKLWAVGNNGTIIYTSNYLFGWISQASGTTENLNDICMVNENEGWAVGDNGTILYFGTTISVGPTESIKDFDIFPNPVLKNMSIYFNLDESFSYLQVFSMNGKCLVSSKIPKLKDHIMLDLSNLDPGIYLLHLLNDHKSTSKRFIKQ